MAIYLTQQQFSFLCDQYAKKDFGFEYFFSIRDLLQFVLHTYDADLAKLDERILDLYDHNKDISNLALEDLSVMILNVEQKWIYIYQTMHFDIIEAMKESWVSFKTNAEKYFLRSS